MGQHGPNSFDAHQGSHAGGACRSPWPSTSYCCRGAAQPACHACLHVAGSTTSSMDRAYMLWLHHKAVAILCPMHNSCRLQTSTILYPHTACPLCLGIPTELPRCAGPKVESRNRTLRPAAAASALAVPGRLSPAAAVWSEHCSCAGHTLSCTAHSKKQPWFYNQPQAKPPAYLRCGLDPLPPMPHLPARRRHPAPALPSARRAGGPSRSVPRPAKHQAVGR